MKKIFYLLLVLTVSCTDEPEAPQPTSLVKQINDTTNNQSANLIWVKPSSHPDTYHPNMNTTHIYVIDDPMLGRWYTDWQFISDIQDNNGFFEIQIPNGEYYIGASKYTYLDGHDRYENLLSTKPYFIPGQADTFIISVGFTENTIGQNSPNQELTRIIDAY